MGDSAIQALVLLALVAGAPPSAQKEKDAPGAGAVPIGIWFDFDAPSTLGRDSIGQRAGVIATRILGPGWTTHRQDYAAANVLVALPPADEAQLTPGKAWELSYRLMREPSVLRAEPVFRAGWPDDSGRALPSPPADAGPTRDPEWSLGPRGANVKAAWEMLPPGEAPGAGVVIAQLDTGFSEHPEIWGSRDGNAGLADWGYDLVDLDADAHDPVSAGLLASPGHGTRTTSVIISRKGSESGPVTAGVTGVAPGALLVPLRVADGMVRYGQDQLAAAVDLAAGYGDPRPKKRVDIISIGLGGPPSLGLSRAIKRAEAAGILIVAPAGSHVGGVVYPARYEQVISVAASNVNGEPWKGSSAGARVDIAAPGEAVWRATTSAAGGAIVHSVGRGSGTSLAAANVAGAAALWLQKNRGDAAIEGLRRSGRMTAAFRKALRRSALVPPNWPKSYGPGVIDVAALLNVPVKEVAAPDPKEQPSTIPCVADIEPVTSLLEGSPDPHKAVQRLLDTNEPCHAASLAPEIASLHAASPAVRAAFEALARDPESAAAITGARNALGAAGPSDTLANALRGEKSVQARAIVPTLVWQSANASIRDLPAEILDLYSALDKTGTLKTRPYVDHTGAGIESILRKEALFFGPTFPPELDALLCRLNAPVCRLEGPRPAWSHRAGGTLNLPDVEFEPEILPRPHQKQPKEPVQRIVVDERKGCEAWTEECSGFITYLNKEPIASLDARGGTVIIPTFLVRARFTVDERSPDLEKRLGDRLLSDVSVSKHGSPDDPHFREQVPVLDLIHHPLAEPDADGTALPQMPMIVGVIDPTDADLSCDFETNPQNAAEKCDLLEPNPVDADHATHVAGIIGARINGRGIVGINPNATVIAKAVAGDAGSSRMNGGKIATSIKELLNARVDVINISMDYELRSPGADGVKQAIKNAPNTLFVVAAGNDARDITDGCDVWPACFANSMPNVLTVVGLDRTKAAPSRWAKGPNQGSNYSTSFHLGAPSMAVLSTLRNGRVGALTGTSQAAPIVAGAASLILAKDRFQPASRVRDRLIASSDFFPNLDSSAVGGRLNVWRALEIENDLLELKANAVARGQLRNRADKITFTTAADDRREEELRQFLRIHRADDDTFTIVIRERDGRLNKFAGATIAGDPEFKLAVTQADNSERVETLKLSALRDFTARLPKFVP